MKKTAYIALISIVSLLISSCNQPATDAEKVSGMPAIFPDYTEVTIPSDIAPMNFNPISADAEAIDVVVKGKKGGEIHVYGDLAQFPIDEWHALTLANKGADLTFTVCIKRNGKWLQYDDFKMYVSNDETGEWGLTYRLIPPGYEVYGHMGLYQRCLSDFTETAIFDNSNVPGACVNCHTTNRTNPAQYTFHVRGEHGATVIGTEAGQEILKASSDTLGGSMVYPYWHPSGKYCAFSTNQTRQTFHTAKDERIEVFDHSSDIFVYEPSTHEMLLDSIIMTKDHFETYPVFSPDGKQLYFCSSVAQSIPDHYKDIKYDLCRIAFNADNGTYGSQVDTLFSASSKGKSLTFPRPSYDGRYLMFTLSDYGCFPIWHKEADLWLLDLKTNEARAISEVNSGDTESFHNWSTNSRWFVFSSRRGGGLYTRLYLSSIDENGRCTKPFLLPQENPWEYYDELIYSYNAPDFALKSLDINQHETAKKIVSDERVATKSR